MKKLKCYSCGRENAENVIQCPYCNVLLAPHTCMLVLGLDYERITFCS
ncbi:MAG: hypothetical protein AB1779_03390 [Candidatus Thermoplasmatota archaeon]